MHTKHLYNKRIVRQQARDCQRELNRFEVKTATDKDLMDSFHHWSLHNVAHFTAAQFVNINAALLYAVCWNRVGASA